MNKLDLGLGKVCKPDGHSIGIDRLNCDRSLWISRCVIKHDRANVTDLRHALDRLRPLKTAGLLIESYDSDDVEHTELCHAFMAVQLVDRITTVSLSRVQICGPICSRSIAMTQGYQSVALMSRKFQRRRLFQCRADRRQTR